MWRDYKITARRRQEPGVFDRWKSRSLRALGPAKPRQVHCQETSKPDSNQHPREPHMLGGPGYQPRYRLSPDTGSAVGLFDRFDNMRQSGAPNWAIALGLGTRSESSARNTRTKVLAWTVWIGVVACVFAAYIAVDPDVPFSLGAVGLVLAISTAVVLGISASSAVLCRLLGIE